MKPAGLPTGSWLVAGLLLLAGPKLAVSGAVPAPLPPPERPLPAALRPCFAPPPEYAGDLGAYRSPLVFADGHRVADASEWPARRREILVRWEAQLGRWPALLERPRCDALHSERADGFVRHRVRIEIAADRFEEGWLLVPAGAGPFPAVLVPFYDPETSAGMNTNRLRAFGADLARRGFVTLSLGSPGGDARRPDPGQAGWQPLSFLAYVAANAHTVLAQRPEVDAHRIGVVGHSYGGKWALFAAALDERFACVAVSDPGIVWDETRPNVNYWEPWYLGRDPEVTRPPGIVTAANPGTGAYRRLRAEGHDLHELHALLAPRPFLVSGGAEDPLERWQALNHLVAVNRLLGFTQRVGLTSRPKHEPTAASNEQIYAFFQHFLPPSNLSPRTP